MPELIEVLKPENKNDDFHVCVVMEYFQSDLNVLLKNKIEFNERQLTKILYNTLLGMSFVHLNNIIHRDIKPGNLLLNSNCDIRICDFGLARTISICEPGEEPLNSIQVRDSLTEMSAKYREKQIA